MKEFFKKVSVSLLTLAVLGSVGGFLSRSLVGLQQKPIAEVTAAQASAPEIETITVVGNKWAK
jgi:hypothetical protein